MAPCTECGGTDTAVHGGSRWCTQCGVQLEAQCQWTFSYSCNRHNCNRRVPVYSRLKRFREWCLKIRIPYVLCNLDSIMDLYAIIEFSWLMDKKARCYFFNKNCILYFCVHILNLERKDDEITTLKDKERVDCQIREMCNLLENHRKVFSYD